MLITPSLRIQVLYFCTFLVVCACVRGIDIDIIIIDHNINFYVPSFLNFLFFISSFPLL